MNLAFTGAYGGVKTGFTFHSPSLPDHTPSGSTPGRWGGRARDEKALSTNAPESLNYYSTTADVYLGWAHLPGLPASRMYLDGIVVDWESMVPHVDPLCRCV